MSGYFINLPPGYKPPSPADPTIQNELANLLSGPLKKQDPWADLANKIWKSKQKNDVLGLLKQIHDGDNNNSETTGQTTNTPTTTTTTNQTTNNDNKSSAFLSTTPGSDRTTRHPKGLPAAIKLLLLQLQKKQK